MAIDSVEKARIELVTNYAVHLDLAIIVHKNGDMVDVVDLSNIKDAKEAIKLVFSETNIRRAQAILQNQESN